MLWLFSCRLEASARGRWHRAGLLRRRGDYYLGCGRRRYCGRVCLSEPEASSGPAAMLLAVSRSPSSIPRRSPCPDRCHLPLASLYTSTPQNLNNTPDCIPHRPIPPSSGVPLYLQQKSPGAQQIQHCQTPEQKEQMSSGYPQSTSLLAHNRITAPQLIAFRSPAKDLIDPVKPQSLPIHCIRLTSRNISFIIQRTIITSQMPLHNIRIPHN